MSRLSDAIKRLADEAPAEVTPPSYAGVSVDHPSIVAAVQKMAKQGSKVREIMKVTGMPAEVVRRHAPDAKSD